MFTRSHDSLQLIAKYYQKPDIPHTEVLREQWGLGGDSEEALVCRPGRDEPDVGAACISYQARTAHMLLLYSVYMIYLFIYENKSHFTYIFTGFVWQYLLVADLVE